MTLQSNASMDEMFAMRQSGASIAQISEAAGLKPMTVYQRLRREYGVAALAPTLPGPANDNNPDRVTRMTPRNGGCSTLSGMVPVTVVRTAADDNAEDEVMAAGLAVHEYALQQVAA
ncbi:hypothetical protein EHS39_30090 [Ensifer sp. MPMI2T]|nr:hypothetical protein EHS39_30090 [Ensifer sp. MPMI2T]